MIRRMVFEINDDRLCDVLLRLPSTTHLLNHVTDRASLGYIGEHVVRALIAGKASFEQRSQLNQFGITLLMDSASTEKTPS